MHCGGVVEGGKEEEEEVAEEEEVEAEEEGEEEEEAGVEGTIKARGSPSFSHLRRVRCTPGGKGRVVVLLAVVVADMGREAGGRRKSYDVCPCLAFGLLVFAPAALLT